MLTSLCCLGANFIDFGEEIFEFFILSSDIIPPSSPTRFKMLQIINSGLSKIATSRLVLLSYWLILGTNCVRQLLIGPN